jgi:catechol 2,3-dioxygenase-like lactoylglutathione lyase family enzyme
MAPNGNTSGLALTQIALVGAVGHRETSAWYQDVLGFADAGSTAFAGPEIAEVQGIDVPNVSLELSWLVDRNEFFQLELFQYLEPKSRPRRRDQSPSDVGYNMVTLNVSDFDGTLDRLARHDVELLTSPAGSPGDRRVCIRDPSGNILEIVETDIRPIGTDTRQRPGIEAAVCAVRVSVPDLSRARRFFVDGLGLLPAHIALHAPEHEALWGLKGAHAENLVLTAGNLYLELVEYLNPRPRPWPDEYQLSDLGIMNIALGSRSPEPYQRVLAKVIEDGHTAHRELSVSPHMSVTYVSSDDGFSVELMFMGHESDRDFGFLPLFSPPTEA